MPLPNTVHTTIVAVPLNSVSASITHSHTVAAVTFNPVAVSDALNSTLNTLPPIISDIFLQHFLGQKPINIQVLHQP